MVESGSESVAEFMGRDFINLSQLRDFLYRTTKRGVLATGVFASGQSLAGGVPRKRQKLYEEWPDCLDADLRLPATFADESKRAVSERGFDLVPLQHAQFFRT